MQGKSMTKKKKIIDNHQISLFDVIQSFQNDKPAIRPVGTA